MYFITIAITLIAALDNGKTDDLVSLHNINKRYAILWEQVFMLGLFLWYSKFLY